MGGHEHKVAVELGRLLVKVAGAQQRQARKRHALAIGELADLGVALKALRAVDDGAAGLFQALGPLDVVLLVEAGAELHKHRDLFAVLGGVDERLAQAALLSHTVERDTQRDALGVVGRLVNQVQERIHGLIGVKEQLVVLQNLFADGAVHVDGGVGLRLKRRKEQLVAQVLGDLALNAKNVAQVERDIAGKDRAARKLERLADGLERLLLERARDGEHYRLQAQALLEDALHMLAVVLFLLDALAVRIDVGVAGDADERAVERLIGAKATVQAGEDDVFEQDVGVGAGGRGDLDHAVHRGGNLDEAQQALLVGDTVQAASQVECTVAQVGEGVARVDDQRRDDRRHVGLEVAGDKGALLGRKRIDARAVDTQGVELALDALEDGLPAVEEPGQLRHNGFDLLRGSHITLVVDGLLFEFGQVGQAAYTDHKELVEVGLEDRDELKALEQRHGLIESLIEHAVVKA